MCIVTLCILGGLPNMRMQIRRVFKDSQSDVCKGICEYYSLMYILGGLWNMRAQVQRVFRDSQRDIERDSLIIHV